MQLNNKQANQPIFIIQVFYRNFRWDFKLLTSVTYQVEKPKYRSNAQIRKRKTITAITSLFFVDDGILDKTPSTLIKEKHKLEFDPKW